MAKQKFKITNWPTYNKALINRGSITFWLDDEAIQAWYESATPSSRGRPQRYSDLAITTVLVIKRVFRLTLRAAQGFIDSIFSLMNVPLRCPDYSCVSRRAKSVNVSFKTPTRGEIAHLVIDSTGLKVFGEGEWKVKKHGQERRRIWRKLHLAVDSKTHEIICADLSLNNVTDSEAFPGLIRQTHRKIRSAAADGAYDTRLCHDELRRKKISALIPPRKGAGYWPGEYADHLPLYRQSEIYRRQGVELSRATLGRWTGAVAELLEPLYDVLRQYVLMPGKVHADDIPVPVQEPGSGKTRTARLWVYVRDDRNAGSQMPPAVWFAYSPDRKGIHPQNHLADYSGVLQADAYGGYRALYESGRITEAACMAHARRKIHDVHARAPTYITTEALQRIGELYAIEAEVRGCSAEQRLAARKARAASLMQSLYDWIQTQMKTLSRHSDTAKAFAYLLKQWEGLNVYCSNGQVEIDNNIAENALRGVAVGRKNWMFAGSDSGGEHAAVLYSLMGTCRLNNVEPEKWLRYVIEHIQDWPANRVRDLLPWKVDLTSQ